MENEVNEFVNPGGEPIGSKIPNIDPKTSAKTTTDKSVRTVSYTHLTLPTILRV